MSLWWLKQVNKRWNVWVQNRLGCIRALVEPSRWYYVSTHSNPADLSTRFNSLKSFRFNSLWWEGPSYLKQDWSHWLLEKIISSDLAHQEERSGSHSLFVNHGVGGIGKVTDCCKFSSFEWLLRVTSYVLRFIGNLKTRITNTGQLRNNEICTEENYNGKILWLRYEQQFISEEENFSKVKNLLNLIKDEKGLLRLKTRLSNHPALNYIVIHPILLQTDSYFTTLVINYFHEENYHNGMNSTLNLVRQNVWIKTGRQGVKKVLKKCFIY